MACPSAVCLGGWRPDGLGHQEAPQADGEEEAPQAAEEDADPAQEQEVAPAVTVPGPPPDLCPGSRRGLAAAACRASRHAHARCPSGDAVAVVLPTGRPHRTNWLTMGRAARPTPRGGYDG